MLAAAWTARRCAVAAKPSRGAEDGRGESSPGADVAAIPVQMWAGVHSVPRLTAERAEGGLCLHTCSLLRRLCAQASKACDVLHCRLVRPTA
jgi:hypothetical protein